MITIIYAHPNPESYNYSILQDVKLVLDKVKKKYQIIDLYNEKFDPVLKIEEMPEYKTKKNSKDIEKYQDMISISEKLIFIYPTWWNSMPAILKGFIDRVFSTDFAYKFEKGMPTGLLKNKKALIISTSGSPLIIEKLLAGNRNIKTMSRDILCFCGIKTSSVQIGTVRPDNKKLKQQLSKVRLATLNFTRK